MNIYLKSDITGEVINLPTEKAILQEVNGEKSGIMIEEIHTKPFFRFKGWCFGDVSFNSKVNVIYHQRLDVKDLFNLDDDFQGISLTFNSLNNSIIKFSICNVEYSLVVQGGGDKTGHEINSFSEENESLLIIGGAPTVKEYINNIKSFKGDVWALNDAVFFLESNGIIPNKLICTDNRFIKKNESLLGFLKCKEMITTEGIFNNNEVDFKGCIKTVKVTSRDGFSTSPGTIYHGCSVFNAALQIAYWGYYKDISTIGVLLNNPKGYTRVDSTKTMPEYVHKIQIYNLKQAKEKLSKIGVDVHAIEFNSSINYI